MRKLLIAAVFIVLANSAPCAARANEFEQCYTLETCLAAIDKITQREQHGADWYKKCETTAAKLKRFGHAAKRALLDRAVGSNPSLRDSVGAILICWHDWSESDLPILKQAPALSHGGWIARVIGEIGSTEAIRILVDDLKFGAQSQTGYALVRIGPKVLPFLLPLLGSEDDAWLEAKHVVKQIDSQYAATRAQWADRVSMAWAEIANDDEQANPSRVGALRGLAALGPTAKPAARRIRNLLMRGATLRNPALLALAEMGDPIVLPIFAAGCLPFDDPFDSAWQSTQCLDTIAGFGRAASRYNSIIRRFMSSQNGEEQIAGISAVAKTNADSELPLVADKLKHQDWRVVAEAIHTLGVRGYKSALPQIKTVSTSHWLPELRAFAEKVAKALDSEKHVYIDAEGEETGIETYTGSRVLGFPAKENQCNTNRWRWKGELFSQPRTEPRSHVDAKFNSGALVGKDYGEFGGGLYWLQKGTLELVLSDQNVVAIAGTREDSAIVVFGLAHGLSAYGYVVVATRERDDFWQMREIARLPVDAKGLVSLHSGLFVTWSDNRAIVFSVRGVEGIADCVK